MALVQISDIVVPEVFADYVQLLSTEKSAFVQSGVVGIDDLLNMFLAGGGQTVNLPHYDDLLDTEANVSTDEGTGVNDAVPEKIATGQKIVIRNNRNQVWSGADLASALAGNDPMEAIARRVSSYWVRQFQTYLINSIRGVIADNIAADSGDMVNSIVIGGAGALTSAHLFSAEAFLDAAQTMGDHQDDLVAVVMHSVVYTRAAKNNLIDFIPDSRGETDIPTFLGRRVIVDDGLPAIDDGNSHFDYSTYLFGADSVAAGEGSPRVPVEVSREALAGAGGGQEFLSSRREFCLHPRGFAWISGSMADDSPDNAELILAANWDRRVARKLVRIAELRTNG